MGVIHGVDRGTCPPTWPRPPCLFVRHDAHENDPTNIQVVKLSARIIDGIHHSDRFLFQLSLLRDIVCRWSIQIWLKISNTKMETIQSSRWIKYNWICPARNRSLTAMRCRNRGKLFLLSVIQINVAEVETTETRMPNFPTFELLKRVNI